MLALTTVTALLWIAAQPEAAALQLMLSSSGPSGRVEGDRFVMEDARAQFRAGVDRQIVVLFEWQGPAGAHRCEATWRDPSGRAVLTSTTQQQARGRRFSVYWTLAIPDTVAPGAWTVEARVDGQPGGVHSFEILPGAATAPRALSLDEIYKRGLAVTADVTGLDARGATLGSASGLLIAPHLVLTTFEAINAAAKVRVARRSQPPVETRALRSWNRRAGWALLSLPGAADDANEGAARAKALPGIGERCYFLELQGDGTRAIVEGVVVGRSAGGDLVLSEGAIEGTLGTPVLNDQGQVVGVLRGGSLLGATLLDARALGVGQASRAFPGGNWVLPLVDFPLPTAETSVTLDELAARGEFVAPLVRIPHFVLGVLGTGVERQGPGGGIPVAAGQRSRFTHADRNCVVFVTWAPGEKGDGVSRFELFDADNRRLADSEPKKVRLRVGQSFVQLWTLNLAAFPTGVFRIDLLLDEKPVWRTFFSVTD